MHVQGLNAHWSFFPLAMILYPCVYISIILQGDLKLFCIQGYSTWEKFELSVGSKNQVD